MDWFAKAFVKASLVWLGAGVTLGVAMAVHPSWEIYKPAHEHMNLLGFVTMMIFGIGYHVLPRIAGRPLYSPRIAGAHWFIANAGLATMVAGFCLRVHTGTVSGGTVLLVVGGTLAALGAYAFIYNIWKTLDGLPHGITARLNTAEVVPLQRPSRQ
ncbi:MAG: cbb3-type cytochrome c oxidase subunit I [Gemmatimonadaceae bacterium]